MHPDRYKRNIPSVSWEEQKILGEKTVSIIGCGGLGGALADTAARMGIGSIRVIDCDVFSESNLNRQLLSNEGNLGKRKADEALKHIKEINSDIKAEAFDVLLTEENAASILKGSDVVIDALDNIKARFTAEHACEELGIYLIHGAVCGWCGQVSTIAPGGRFFEKIYPKDAKTPAPSVLSFTPGFIAGIQISEAVKVLLGKGDILENKLLIADLQSLSFNIIDF